MSENIIVTFALLFGATIALICAVYVALGARKTKKQHAIEYDQKQ